MSIEAASAHGSHAIAKATRQERRKKNAPRQAPDATTRSAMSKPPPKKRARASPAAAAPPLPARLEELATLHSATLTVAQFMAPKGVICSLPLLQQSVLSLAQRELRVEHLQQMVALDDRLGLRYAMIPPATGGAPEQVLELVLREPLKTASPGSIRARTKRFRSLLQAVASAEPPVPLPLAPLPAAAPSSGVGGGGGGGGGGAPAGMTAGMAGMASMAGIGGAGGGIVGGN